MTETPTRRLRTAFYRITLVVFLCASGAAGPTRAEDAPTVPLPPEIAKDLELLGKGFMGKALPAPPIEDIHEYLNLGAGDWEYEILHGGKDGQKVRTESYEKAPPVDGAEVWKRTLGSEYVEYIRIEHGTDPGKHLEDDLDLGYSSRFKPGVVWLANSEAGTTTTVKNTIEAYKTKNPDKVSYTGEMTANISYVGMYEVTTPAGTFPAALMRSEFDIKIGPAKVTDTMYVFFAKGVGKVAEIEATRISALFVYNSNTQVAKVLTKYPKR